MAEVDRIQQLHKSRGTGLITEADILIAIPDLTLQELMVEAKKALDPYPDESSSMLYKTDLFIKSQNNFVESFLREAIKDVKVRPLAERLGIEWGFWKDES